MYTICGTVHQDYAKSNEEHIGIYLKEYKALSEFMK